jgi:diguanylate cyclase (GGDEF)-like protein
LNCEQYQRRVWELEQEIIELKRELLVDHLTGVYNRRFYDEALAREIELVRRGVGLPLSLVVFDLDHFKRVNDTYGHPVGDRVLRLVGELARKHLRASDLIARIGGEEFAMILRGNSIDEAVTFTNRLRTAFENELQVPLDSEGVLSVTASFGIAEWFGDDSFLFLKRADQALYKAKRSGRNCLAIATT